MRDIFLTIVINLFFFGVENLNKFRNLKEEKTKKKGITETYSRIKISTRVNHVIISEINAISTHALCSIKLHER